MPFEPTKPGVKSLEPGDPIGDVGTAFADEPRQLGGRVGAMARVTPARDPAGVPERNVESAKVDQQAQVLDVRLAVLAIVVVPS